MNTKPFLTIREICVLLDISRNTFYRWRKAGFIPPPAIDAPLQRRWRRDDIEDWISSGPDMKTEEEVDESRT